jgi:hypothetical protein
MAQRRQQQSDTAEKKTEKPSRKEAGKQMEKHLMPRESFQTAFARVRRGIFLNHVQACFAKLHQLYLGCRRLDSPTGAFVALDAFRVIYKEEFENQKRAVGGKFVSEEKVLYAAHDHASDLAIDAAITAYENASDAQGEERLFDDMRTVLKGMTKQLARELRSEMQRLTQPVVSPPRNAARILPF